ncbi:MAG: cell division protein FtsH [Chloroflexi bacterium]|nr:cell division protein FtsH [Chloroflexota bacterium]|tara:strand:- start:47476 stop:49407 length:1932 start_codon:yes stop_codon:yes gene_type:complete
MNKKLLNNSLTYIIAGLLLVGAFYFFLGNSFDSSEEKDLGHLVRISKSAEGTAYPVNIEVSGDKLTYSRNGEVFKASKEPGTSVYEIMSASGVDPSSYSVQVKNGGGIGTIFSILIGLLPFILMFGFLFFIMRQAQGGGSNAMNFGKSRAKMFVGTKANVTFFDVAGLPEAKEELEEVVEFLKFPDRFTSIGAKIPSGVLLVGPPGTGKTLLARAVAGEAGVPFFSISGSEFVEMFVGVGASRVRDLFSQAKRHSPCIIFVDEIDAVGRHRGAGLGGGHDEREQTLNQILVEMDGFDTNNNVIVIAATNRPDILDPALLRPGRFDRRVTIDNPDVNGRTEILGVHAKGKPIDSKVDLATVAKQTPGFSGADLANLINESALLAARNNAKKIHLADLTEAIDRVSIGPARKSKVISEKERKLVAYHEAGHAIVSYYMPEGKTVGKITIVSRGHAGGFTRYEQEDQSLMTKIELEAMIASLMGGREAEFLTEGVLTTGASNDFEQATRIAREAVMRYGMIPDLAQRTYGKKQQAVFLGREQNEEQDYSNETAVKIDKEIDKLLTSGKNNANKILKKQKKELDLLANALLKHETLDADQFKDLMEGKEVDFSATTIVREPKTEKDRIEDKAKKDKAKKGFPEPQSS